MNIFFTSDHHFSHANIIKYCKRPFRDIHEMNQVMVTKWNSVVSVDDIVYYLGDFSLSKDAMAQYLPQLNGIVHLVPGNHDHCHPAHTKNPEKLQKMLDLYLETGFSSVSLHSEMLIGELSKPLIEAHSVVLHHMPYLNKESEQYDARYKEYRPTDTGKWLLHGHVHDNWKIKNRMINVGVDVWFFSTVSIEQIREIIYGPYTI